MSRQISLAAFVKTPGLTAAKTRLAKGIGPDLAADFYQQSINCVLNWAEEIQQRDNNIQFCLAVAEPIREAAAVWGDRRLLPQGEGGLAARLEQIYQILLAEAAVAGLIGMDAPQLDHKLWAQAIALLKEGNDFVIGPAADGGFYLLLGCKPISSKIWQNVPYSNEKTFAILVEHLQKIGTVAILPCLTDADHQSDLPAIIREIRAADAPSMAQQSLLTWLEKLFSPRATEARQ